MSRKSGMKQHIGCSMGAYSIIMEDYKRFNPNKSFLSKDEFLNDLLLACGKDAYIITQMHQNAGSNGNEGRIFNKIERNEKRCRKSFNLYESTAESLHLFEDNNPLLKSYRTAGIWINEVFETYAEMPYLFRERIIFHKTISTLRIAIQTGKLVLAQTMFMDRKEDEDSQYIFQDQCFLPYAIRSDSMGVYLYICGMNLKKDDNEKIIKSPIAFRISRLRNIETKETQYSLDQHDKDILEDLMLEKGIQYIIGEAVDAEILLSEKGLQLYQRKIWNRPAIELVERYNDKYKKFRCHATSFQIRNYFTSAFGPDAVILSPPELREKIVHKAESMIQMYDLFGQS